MNLYNKQNYQIAAIKRNNLSSFKSRKMCYDLVVCKKSKHNKRFVVEKLGSISNNKFFFINNFRLIYWLQFNVSFNIKAWLILKIYISILNKISKDAI